MFHTFPRTNNNKTNQGHWSNCEPYWSYTYNFTRQSQSVRRHRFGLSDQDMIYCTRKTYLLKSHKHNEIFVRPMKRYSPKKFLENLREVVFPDYLTYTCVNNAYSDFIYRFVWAINFIAPAKKIRVKANSKPWFDNQIASAIQRRNKL